MTPCPHTTAGCSYPGGECLGACLADHHIIQPKPKALPTLIGLVGPAGCGKDTVAEMIHGLRQTCFVIVDVRTPSEVNVIRAQGGVLWRIERPQAAPVRAHASESAGHLIECDLTLDNSGTLDQLWSKVHAAAMGRLAA
ncbi:hypothetical protein [Malikia sp.]|uniref:hypothetical protein n=1 Tax=Malikia sp. TaxID=2070706 RepID=UPI0026041854|nr:hypothetical protein [Malikia sp.]MDD2730378.1 hypothetical protein [Malikia sp.]